jgi:hypothetical protein
MSAVIGEVKKIERVDYRPDSDCGEALGIEASATGTPLKRLIDYAIRRTYVEKIEDVDITYDINELENRILAAESKLKARDRQISTYSSMLQEKDRLITQLKTQLKKAMIPTKNIYVLCAWVLAIGLVSGIGISVLIFYLFPMN